LITTNAFNVAEISGQAIVKQQCINLLLLSALLDQAWNNQKVYTLPLYTCYPSYHCKNTKYDV